MRPLDQQTARAVEKERGLDVRLTLVPHKTSCDPDRGAFNYESSGYGLSFSDPRGCPNAALRLLHYITREYNMTITPHGNGWMVTPQADGTTGHVIGLSYGIYFCYETVALAIKMMGIKESTNGDD